MLAVVLAHRGSAVLCSFARSEITRKVKITHGDGEVVVRPKQTKNDEAMDDLLKPSPLLVAGMTQGVSIAKATAVAKIRIKQFLAIPLAGKVVGGPCE